jgi:hypothetical protein
MRNTADVTRGKPIAVFLQSISGVSTINSLVAFYDIHEGKREVLFFYFLILLLSISGGDVVNPLVAFYDTCSQPAKSHIRLYTLNFVPLSERANIEL